jgi:hypothetical protein
LRRPRSTQNPWRRRAQSPSSGELSSSWS